MTNRIAALISITMLMLAVTGYTSSICASQKTKAAESTAPYVETTAEQTNALLI